MTGKTMTNESGFEQRAEEGRLQWILACGKDAGTRVPVPIPVALKPYGSAHSVAM
jgi:hypothetical protein